MNDQRKSDSLVVPMKPPNKVKASTAEVVEGRRLAKRNATSKTHPGPSAGKGAPSALDRVRQVARRDRKAKFTALFHHVNVERLRGAFKRLKKKAAAGVDGVTWEQYEDRLEDNLQDLHRRLRQGAYRAKPSRTSVVTSNVAIGGHFKSSQRKGRDGWKLLLGVRGFQVRGSGAPAVGPEFEDVSVVEEAVEGGGDGSGVAEELAPVFNGAV
jgi:hypothetical protein